MFIVIATVAAILTLPAAANTSQGAEPSTPDLTGAWKYNADLSLTPKDRSTPSNPGAGSSPGANPAGRASGGEGARPNPEHMAKMREALRNATEASERLTIVRKENAFVITDGDGRSWSFVPDGRKVKGETPVGLKVETTAWWEAPLLIVERRFDGGVSVTDQYTLLTDPRQLVIMSIVETDRMKGDQAIRVRRVYDVAQ